MLKKLTEEKGDVGAMKQFVVLGIFILIGVIVYANIFASAGLIRVTGESANSTGINETSDTYTVAYATGGIYSTPVVTVYVAGNEVVEGSNYSMAYATGILTMENTNTMNNSGAGGLAVTLDYTRSAAGNEAAGKTTIDTLNTTWYNSVNLLIIVFLVIAAVVILAYVGRIGGGGQ